MKTNELRIGNYVLDGALIQQVCAIDDGAYINSEKIAFRTDEYGQWLWLNFDNIKPISLTPEILEKCGFKESYNYKTFYKDQFRITIHKNGNTLTTTPCNNGDGRRLKNIKYLHQLQNLYFAHTEEELEIDL
jgi:hypothetical protein